MLAGGCANHVLGRIEGGDGDDFDACRVETWIQNGELEGYCRACCTAVVGASRYGNCEGSNILQIVTRSDGSSRRRNIINTDENSGRIH